jgi:SAM-dependent methyltransferase
MINHLYKNLRLIAYKLVLGPYQQFNYAIANYRIGRRAGSMDVFYEIYRKKLWNSSESVSGTGSTISNTYQLRQALPSLFDRYSIKSILDLPCGDFNWMRRIELGEIKYIGGDLVSDLIEKNKKYEAKNIIFIRRNLIIEDLPSCDLLMVRDCLVHFSYFDIDRALQNIKRSGCKYLLTTSFEGDFDNTDIRTGFWRPINLRKPPFNFPEPIDVVSDFAQGIFSNKNLLMWRINSLPNGIH